MTTMTPVFQTPPTMTLAQFRATREQTVTLYEASEGACTGPGWTYFGDIYIEVVPHADPQHWSRHVTFCIDRDDFTIEGPGALIRAEEILYRWAVGEGVIAAPSVEPDPQVERVARDFARRLHDELTPGEMMQVLLGNARESDPQVCHSHDFCDPNELMAAAMRACDVEPDVGDEAVVALWNAAWDLAKAHDFYCRTLA